MQCRQLEGKSVWHLFPLQIQSMHLKLCFAAHCHPVAYERTSCGSAPATWSVSMLKNNFQFVDQVIYWAIYLNFLIASRMGEKRVASGKDYFNFYYAFLHRIFFHGVLSLGPSKYMIFLAFSPPGEKLYENIS